MDQLATQINGLFKQQNHIDIAAMLKPIQGDDPVGPSLRDDGLYQTIHDARTEDDNSTPRGVWEFDMRRADWDAVYQLTTKAIKEKSKDIQLAAWMMEAQLMRVGFSSIAPSMHLLMEMLRHYWDGVHPRSEGGDNEHRLNIFSWINSKLLIVIKQIPITDRRDIEQQYSWADWEMALRNTQTMNAHPDTQGLENEIDVDTVVLNINHTATEFYQQLYNDLELALLAIDSLTSYLDQMLGQDSPSFGAISNLLEEIAGMAYHQLDQRGMLTAIGHKTDEQDDATIEQIEQSNNINHSTDAVQNRSEAYAALQRIADYLVVDDPHSPAPYLIYKAIDWGRMDTSQLYNELFVKRQGQLNIFEVLGIQLSEQTVPS